MVVRGREGQTSVNACVNEGERKGKTEEKKKNGKMRKNIPWRGNKHQYRVGWGCERQGGLSVSKRVCKRRQTKEKTEKQKKKTGKMRKNIPLRGNKDSTE